MLYPKKFVCMMSLLGVSAFASADTMTVTGTINVVLNLQNVCVVSNVKSQGNTDFGTLNFGSPGSLAANVDAVLDISSNAGVQVTCSKDQNYHIALGPGQNASSESRQLKGPKGDLIPYALYRDSSRSSFWGNGTFGARVDTQGTGNAQTWPIYGRIPGTPTMYPSGSYSDKVEVEIGW
jgi:spore coat protein U-like protein